MAFEHLKIIVVILFLAISLSLKRVRERFFCPYLTVTFFDVGQGDSSLIQFPKGKTLLIDTGGGSERWDMGKAELIPELSRLGILTIDQVLLTHPDRDHGGGLLGLLGAIRIRKLSLNRTHLNVGTTPPLLNTIIQNAKLHQIDLEPLSLHRSLQIGESWISHYAIQEPTFTKNERSVVTLVNFGGCYLLFTGDIEGRAERRLQGYFPNIDILKVAHHGSKTSSTPHFLATIHPMIAVISTGINNRYGHPHKVAVLGLRAMGTQIFRTDFHGFVRFQITQMGEISCETAHGFCGKAYCRNSKRRLPHPSASFSAQGVRPSVLPPFQNQDF